MCVDYCILIVYFSCIYDYNLLKYICLTMIIKFHGYGKHLSNALKLTNEISSNESYHRDFYKRASFVIHNYHLYLPLKYKVSFII